MFLRHFYNAINSLGLVLQCEFWGTLQKETLWIFYAKLTRFSFSQSRVLEIMIPFGKLL